MKLLLSVMVLAPAAALAQQLPPPEAGQQIVNVAFTNGQFRMRDRETDAPLIDIRGLKPHSWSNEQGLPPEISVSKQPAGFDITFVFHNTTAEPKPVGDFNVGIITLGPDLTFYDMRSVCKRSTIHMDSYTNQSWWYPDDLYSPVVVMANSTHAMGISLQYPILEYKHDTVVSLCKMPGSFAAGEGGMGWMVQFGCSGDHPGPMKRPGLVPPGEEWTYVISVRVTKKTDEWLRTLTPYRQYFRATYGGVQYQRNVDPMVGVTVAEVSVVSPSNPSGWTYPQRRPDVNGWLPWVKYITQDMGAYKRSMLWAPSGLYNLNMENNYPFQFTTRWMMHPKVKTAIHPSLGLPRVKQTGRELGLWWGRALQVATEWNAAQLHPLDFQNPADVSAGMAEFDLAVQAGAGTIGLDSFVHDMMPIWDQVEWIQKMSQYAPGVKFAFEPSTCDIMHRLGANVIDGFPPPITPPQSPDDLYHVKHPNYISDFLLPGHETWVLMHWEAWHATFGQYPSVERKRQDVISVASHGYVAVMFAEDLTQPSSQFKAAKSWEHSVPVDLQGWPTSPAGDPGAGMPKGSSRYYDRAELLRALERSKQDPP